MHIHGGVIVNYIGDDDDEKNLWPKRQLTVVWAFFMHVSARSLLVGIKIESSKKNKFVS